jgi:hypothetical protein
MPSSTRACSEKIRLVADYGAGVAAYYSAVSELEASMITGSAYAYEKGHRASEEAHLMCENARKALNDHVADHGC